MELWFTENHTKDARFSIRVDRQVYTYKSYYQQIDIFDTPEFGRILALDGCLMITEKDEFIYHDMIVHVPMAVNPHVRSVLVIGAGDGGAVRELTRYPGIEQIHMVEIDEAVVDACMKYIPSTSHALTDERVTIFYEDGLPFVRRSPEEKYDLIIVDSTDPFGPGEGLFTREFYGNCYKTLTENGILVNQMESAFYETYSASLESAWARITKVFPKVSLYRANIPTYPSGGWLFGFASKQADPLCFDAETWLSLGIRTKYYNPEMHKAAFALPNYIRDLL